MTEGRERVERLLDGLYIQYIHVYILILDKYYTDFGTHQL